MSNTHVFNVSDWPMVAKHRDRFNSCSTKINGVVLIITSVAKRLLKAQYWIKHLVIFLLRILDSLLKMWSFVNLGMGKCDSFQFKSVCTVLQQYWCLKPQWINTVSTFKNVVSNTFYDMWIILNENIWRLTGKPNDSCRKQIGICWSILKWNKSNLNIAHLSKKVSYKALYVYQENKRTETLTYCCRDKEVVKHALPVFGHLFRDNVFQALKFRFLTYLNKTN